MKVDQLLDTLKLRIINIVPQVTALRNEREQKADLSYVTKGDLMINELVREVVLLSDPGAVIVSEEQAYHGMTNLEGTVVVVDPIDGTENFTSGLPEWGVSVSCFNKGKHVGSLLGCPEMSLWLRSGDQVPNFVSRIRGISSSLQKEELIRTTEGFEYRMMGCCVYNMINVIRGSFLSFENPKGAHSWDILGGLNLAREHNLRVLVNDKEYTGEYLPADKKYRFWVGR